MATLPLAEMMRVRAELFDNVLAGGAATYVSVGTIFDVIASNVESSSITPTTSATTVSAPGPTELTLASATGLASGSRVVLDVDAAREVVTVRAVFGSVISVVCAKTHSGIYPVEVESPLTIVRGLLADLEALDQQGRQSFTSAGLKRVEEIEFFGRADGTVTATLGVFRSQLRERLAAACGLTKLWRDAMARARPVATYEVY